MEGGNGEGRVEAGLVWLSLRSGRDIGLPLSGECRLKCGEVCKVHVGVAVEVEKGAEYIDRHAGPGEAVVQTGEIRAVYVTIGVRVAEDRRLMGAAEAQIRCVSRHIDHERGHAGRQVKGIDLTVK